MIKSKTNLMQVLLVGVLAGVSTLGAGEAVCATQPSPGYLPPLADTPMNQIVQSKLYPQLDFLSQKLLVEKEQTAIGGHPAFNGKDKFLPGKIAIGLGHILLNAAPGDPKIAQYVKDFRDIADMTAGMDNHTWGIYYYLLALYDLKKAGLLEQAVSPQTLAILKKKLDWRLFVTQPDFKLINLPTNYYGVAFGVARLRMLLGWEDDSASKQLLEKLLNHYEAHSGKYGFSDETDGEGRFDRYSILLIAEICDRFIETGMTVTPELKAKLRKAADIALNLGNAAGEGFSFGRSIGVYGETAMLDILSASAYLGILTPEEKEYAYTYSTHIVARYVDFWYDPATHSVDMWGKGRRTDAYRGIHRILGENFSLLHQLMIANEVWNKAGFKNAVPKSDLQAWLDKTQPPFKLTWFAQGEYDRALAIFRDRRHVFSLLMVNGGASQHANSPYYPLPFSNMLIAGVADSGSQHPQLLPKFTLADGSELIGTAFIKDIAAQQSGEQYHVSYRQDGLTRLGDGNRSPLKDTRMTLETEYTLQAGVITRTDKYTPTAPLQIEHATLEFASFSDQATVNGTKVQFAEGDVSDFEVAGLKTCRAEKTQGSDLYKSPNGPMRTHVSCSLDHFTLKEPLTIKWTIRYH
ncbi:hypothetical protein [Undibacterium sp.]|uniref:hypothetical protein n=1 Tax=Undibacterium sp. TaxID=1914977 RepID=UPI002CA9C5D1|nr:hypothetical protein [Undibacterium sp.]HTD03398.1 hypothetical protein [Undibacterium sp.]